MTPRLTVLPSSRSKESGVDKRAAEAKRSMLKRIGPEFGSTGPELSRALKKLNTSLGEDASMLDKLLKETSADVLGALPSTLISERRRDLFMETEAEEDALLIEDDEVDAHIDAKETLRFPKFILLFWDVARIEGLDNAKVLLETTLATMALYELLFNLKKLDPDMLSEMKVLEALPDFYREILAVDGEAPLNPAVDVAKLREDVTDGVMAEMVDVDELFRHRLVNAARQNFERAIDESINDRRDLYFFAKQMLSLERLEEIADKILAAAPQRKLDSSKA